MAKTLLDEGDISVFQTGGVVAALQIASAFKASSDNPGGINVVVFKNSGFVSPEDEDGQTVNSAVNATHKNFIINNLDDAINVADMLCYPDVERYHKGDIIADVASEIKKGNISYDAVRRSDKERLLSPYGLP